MEQNDSMDLGKYLNIMCKIIFIHFEFTMARRTNTTWKIYLSLFTLHFWFNVVAVIVGHVEYMQLSKSIRVCSRNSMSCVLIKYSLGRFQWIKLSFSIAIQINKLQARIENFHSAMFFSLTPTSLHASRTRNDAFSSGMKISGLTKILTRLNKLIFFLSCICIKSIAWFVDWTVNGAWIEL